MEKEESQSSRSIVYDFRNECDKHYFAGLLNQADFNFRLALVELAKRCGIGHGLKRANEGDNNEQETISWIKNSFGDTLSQTDWNHRTRLFCDFFPFVGKIMDYKTRVDRASFREDLILLYENLMRLRHYYTHMHHDAIEIDRRVFVVLDKLLLQAAKTVRKRRLRNENYKPAFPKQFEKDYLEAVQTYEKHNAGVDELFKIEKLNTGFSLKAFTKEHHKYKKEDYHRIYLNRAMSEVLDKDQKTGELLLKTNQKSESADQEGQLSSGGFIFLLCLFLSRKEAEDVLDHTRYFKAGYQLRYLVKRWVYTVFCCKGIRHALRSEFSKEALLLQMVDELSKCPAELFEVLPDDKQQEFVMDRNEYYKDNVENDATPEASLVSHLVVRKRYQDRFPYFVVRFLDEFAGFQSLRFQLKLGKYNHDTRTKTFKGINTTTERSIREEIKVFGKLSDVQKAKQDFFANRTEIDENSIRGWLQYPNVSYVLDNNNVPIYFANFTEKLVAKVEKERKDKPTKLELVTEMGCEDTIFSTEAPHAFLSTNELPALIHQFFVENAKKKNHPNREEHILGNPIGKGIEFKVVSKIRQHYQSLSKMNNEENLSDKTIPKRLLKSLKEGKTAGEIDFAKLTNAINQQITDCKQKQSWITTKKEEYRKRIAEDRKRQTATKNYWILSAKEIGEIATWLAEDIKRYVSKTDRKFWKGRHQAELQALLAFFDTKKAKIRILLEDEIGINITKYSVLESLFSKNTIDDAYNAYLSAKEKSLDGYIGLIENNAANYQQKPIRKAIDKIFEHFDKSKYVYINSTYLDQLRQKPINLPRGLFDDKLVFTSKGNEDERQTWFALAEDAPKQAFYMYRRCYRVIDEKGKIKELKSFDTHENINKKADFDTEIKKRIVTNEKHIRKIARQDYYLLEMIKFLFEDLNIEVDSENITLADAFLERDFIQQNVSIARNQSKRQEGDCSKNVHRLSNLLEKRINIKLFKGKISITDIALKDLGKCRALEKDGRIYDLLSYGDRSYTIASELICEIENYEYVRRHEILKAVHKLEGHIYNLAERKNDTEQLKNGNGNPDFNNYIAYYYTQKGMAFDKNSNPLILIRNKFAHNQLPAEREYKAIIRSISVRREGELIGDYLLRVFSSTNIEEV